MNLTSTANRKKHIKNKPDVSRSPRTKRTLLKQMGSDEPVNIKLFLVLNFKVEEYASKVHYPEEMKIHWRSNIYRNPITLAKCHFQKMVELARFDQRNVVRHIKYLNQVTPNLSFVMDSTGIEFEGLTKEQVKECDSNKDFEFEILEITC